MRYPVIDLLLIALLKHCQRPINELWKDTYPGIGLRDTLRDDLLVAFLMTCISTVLALISSRVKQKLAAECA